MNTWVTAVLVAVLAGNLAGCAAGPTKYREREGDFILNLAAASAPDRIASVDNSYDV